MGKMGLGELASVEEWLEYSGVVGVLMPYILRTFITGDMVRKVFSRTQKSLFHHESTVQFSTNLLNL